ncbi:SET domain-containing protein [Atractiella rhizophila]|nr:SET domain-containing protein [Atractiella rhizophila]
MSLISYEPRSLLETHNAKGKEVASLLDSIDLKDGPITRRTVIGGDKHYSKQDLRAMKRVDSLLELREGVNKGVFIFLQVNSSAFRTVAIHFVAVDQQGNVAPVHLLHLPRSSLRPLEHLVPFHAVFVLQEPYVRQTQDGFILRVESPTDIVWSPSFDHFSLTPSFYTALFAGLSFTIPNDKLAGNEWKKRGNIHYQKKEFHSAMSCYSRGIACSGNLGSEKSLLRLNRAATLLVLDFPGAALRDLSLIEVSALGTGPHMKYLVRKATALYNIGAFQASFDLSTSIFKEFASLKEAQDILDRSGKRLEETRGHFNFAEMYHHPPSNGDVAPFIGPIVLRKTPSSGRGLFATRQIRAGEVLLVSAPLASVHVGNAEKELVVGANSETGMLASHAQVELAARLVERMEDNPYVHWMVEQLWPGPHKAKLSGWQAEEFDLRQVTERHLRGETFGKSMTGIDVALVESAIAFNVFRPETITQPRAPDAAETNAYAPAALYFYSSFMNSACLGNALYSFIGDVWILRASRSIAEGEEVMDTYIDPCRRLEDREEVASKHGFVCRCELCVWDRMDGVQERKKRADLMSNLSRGLSLKRLVQLREKLLGTYHLSCSPLSTTNWGPRTILSDVYTVDRIIADLYRQAGDISAAIGFLEKSLEDLGLPVSRRKEMGAITNQWIARIRVVDVILVALELGSLSDMSGKKDDYLFYLGLAKLIDEQAFGAGLPISRHAI